RMSRGLGDVYKRQLLDLLALALAPDPGGRFEFLAGERPRDIAALWRDGRQDRLAALRRQHCGYVLQSGGLLEFLDVRRNIGLPCALLGAPSAERVQALAERLEIGDQLDLSLIHISEPTRHAQSSYA
ncbi:hypothetical protein KZ843_39495, partial [Pseudomonas aeruginosa]|nr:hypothetical protein [Pseudomonas aeruginosa]